MNGYTGLKNVIQTSEYDVEGFKNTSKHCNC